LIVFYLDTCVLAAYYCPEPLSVAVGKALRHVTLPATSRLVACELSSALSQKVRSGELSRSSAGAVLAQFKKHLRDGHFRSVEIGPREYDLAEEWLNSFSTPLRALDALHLAVAASHGLALLTTDKALAVAAKSLGVQSKLISA